MVPHLQAGITGMEGHMLVNLSSQLNSFDKFNKIFKS